ncbi:hypothetical protein V6N13_069442 [Hibiscus sabdariffa]
MAMASDHRIIDIADSSMEDETEISHPPDIAQLRINTQICEIVAEALDHLMRFHERITQVLEPLPKAREMWSQARLTGKPYMFRVPHRLREVNKRAYEPNVISIGPYHHANERLKRTEAIKLSCFLHILWEDSSVADRIVRTMESLEARVRECYEEPSDLNSQEFVEMMVYDGCFIVQLILGFADADIFKERGILGEVVNDLLLLENQLPFFVLSELYHIIAPEEEDVHQLAHHVISFFRDGSLFHLFDDPVSDEDIKHLLHLVHSSHHPSDSGMEQHQKFKKNATNSDHESRNSRAGVQNIFFSQMAARIWDWMHHPLTASEPTSQRKTKFIGNATELDEAGIDFLGATLEKMKDLKQGIETEFDIMFTKDTKVLMIPTLRVVDSTESRFRNYIAYEQFIPYGKPTYFSDYVLLMDNLINTSKDVQLLRKSGIIDNWLGDDEAVAQMFNKLHHSVYWSSSDFYYAHVFGRVNQHCQRKWNRWKAVLKTNYFNSPWSHISFLAATLLLLLTAIQTVFSFLSYYDQ